MQSRLPVRPFKSTNFKCSTTSLRLPKCAAIRFVLNDAFTSMQAKERQELLHVGGWPASGGRPPGMRLHAAITYAVVHAPAVALPVWRLLWRCQYVACALCAPFC